MKDHEDLAFMLKSHKGAFALSSNPFQQTDNHMK